MLSHIFLLIFLQICQFVRADMDVVEPTANSAFSPSSGTVSITLEMTDDGDYPTLTDYALFKILLCSGANDDVDCFYTIENSLSPASLSKTTSDGTTYYSYDVSFASTVVGSGQFFLQVFCMVDSNDYTLHYSPRFSLSSMRGTVTTYTYSGDSQPSPQYVLPAEAAATSINSASFSITYTLQTGRSRFAPMQMQPNTTVTRTAWTTKYPTSAVTYYSTFPTTAQQKTTITPGWSYTFISAVNYATPAPCPTDNGGWYEPSRRLSLSARKVN